MRIIIKSIIICGLATGFALSAYSIFVKLRGKGFRSRLLSQEKAQTNRNTKTKMLKSTRNVKPLRMWIDGKCFNLRRFKRKARETKQKFITHTEGQSKVVSEEVDIVDVEYKNEIDVITDAQGKLSLSFHLPSVYYKKLQQFPDLDVRHLSTCTQTNILWPRQGRLGKLTIEGHDRKNIEDAVNEIHSVIGAIREQLSASQFISIPILSQEVRENFEKFKAGVLNESGIKGMHESIFQSALKLHLTVVVFALLDDREKAEAVKALEEYNHTILGPLLKRTGPLKVSVEGINCMHNNYKKTDVLYANVKIIKETEEANLQKIANDLAHYFYEKGLVLRHTDTVKLHMTLINTKYRNSSETKSPQRKRWVKRESFDASLIMEKYKNFVFGECDLDSIHLSIISTQGDDGFYRPLSVIKF